ncbi:hypothetical protein V7094_25550 [Priestia megaterium]|uniref:hypothetical protein n=1 Tax=Priestia megaterium TaxID=1404 RepID=UPI002FFE1A4C
MTDKIKKEQITAMTKVQAEENARKMKDAVIVPIYVAISLDEEGEVSRIDSPSLSGIYGKVIDRPEVPFTEGQYQTYKAISKELEANQSMGAVKSAYEALKDFINSVSEETLYLIRERYESEVERPSLQDATPKYSDGIKKYSDDIKKM